MNTEQIKNAKNLQIFKLMNNEVFGKTVENVITQASNKRYQKELFCIRTKLSYKLSFQIIYKQLKGKKHRYS